MARGLWYGSVGAGAAAAAVAAHDLLPKKHSVLRNYPVIGHMRYLLEGIRPELQQYFIERNWDGRPFDRDTRSIIYERAKGTHSEQSYGTEREVMRPGYEHVVHSTVPVDPPDETPRVSVGGPRLLPTVRDVAAHRLRHDLRGVVRQRDPRPQRGARRGGFAHDMGEGGLSGYHLENGGDLVWEIGTGYFSTRTENGDFGTELDNPDITAVARAMGLASRRVTDPKDISEAVRTALATNEPYLLDFVTNADEVSLPPKPTLSQAWGFAIAKSKETLESR